MSLETSALQLVANNLIGVAFGFLMYHMANTSIKENTKVTQELKELISILIHKLRK